MSVNFNGSSYYLNNNTGILTAAPFTFACWFNPTNAGIQTSLMSLGALGTNNQYFEMQANTGHIAAETGATSNATATTSNSYSANTWNHACAVFYSASSRAAFLNGSGKGTDANSRTPSGISGFRMGLRAESSAVLWYPGLMMEAALWSVALSDNDVAMLAAGFSPLYIEPNNLVSYWPLTGRFFPEQDLVGGFTLSQNGSGPVQADHYRIINRPQRMKPRVQLMRTINPTGIATRARVGSNPGFGKPTLNHTQSNQVASGGMVISGTSGVKVGNKSGTSGGITLSGTCPIRVGNKAAGTGGMVLSGATAQKANYKTPVSGGMSTSGSAGVKANYKFTTSGTILVPGDETDIVFDNGVEVQYFTSMRGGMFTDGTAGIKANYTAAGSGGMVIGGSSPATSLVNLNYVPSGGMVLSGSAPVHGFGFIVSGTGGMVLSGTSPAKVTYITSSTGAIVLNGAASGVSLTLPAMASGGMVLDGTAPAKALARYMATATGTMIISGSAPVKNGNVQDFIANLPTGGITLGGKATALSYRLDCQNPFATPMDFVTQYSAPFVGELVGDDGKSVDAAGLADHPVLITLLAYASGEVVAAALVGERYTQCELQALTGDEKAFLQCLTCQIAFRHLTYRRSRGAQTTTNDARIWLEQLRKGERIFGIGRDAISGHANHT